MSSFDQGSLFNPTPPQTATEPAAPIDQAARDRITSSLDETLFVEAGAGSGKTRSLVSRVVSLVRAGIKIDNIAAITFTEKAASELRDRVRQQLESEIVDNAAAGIDTLRLEEALHGLDGAAISTLHAFAQRILSEYPVEAQLPPGVEVQDEISSQVSFEDRWQQFIDQLLEDEPSAHSFLVATAVGVTLDHLRQVASAFNANWDLVEERLLSIELKPIELNISWLIDRVEALMALGDECADPSDKMALQLAELGAYIGQLRSCQDDIELLERLVNPSVGFRKNLGTKKNWPYSGFSIDEVREEIAEFLEQVEASRSRIADEALTQLAARLAKWTIEAAEVRRQEGRLEYHDLLVRSRQMLRDREQGLAVRQSLSQRYQRLLLDEFQDTDPIQIELACLIASTDEDGTKPWGELTIPAGSLFFVGDPKQSIYRFRRADIRLFLNARGSFADEPVRLTTNFRTTEPIIDWVNHVFGRLIAFEEGSQPEYQALGPVRSAAPGGKAVVTVGEVHPQKSKAEWLRASEARDVANIICMAIKDEWQVADRAASTGWRPANLGDITILLPARTSLAALERALDDADIAYRAETSSLVYSTGEVRDLMAVLRSVADPTDELALATALRSPIFGCGDDDLYTFKREFQGHWNHQAPRPESLPADHPVGEAMLFLCELYESQMWMAPSELIERIVRERRVLELAFADRRPRDLWRRFRFLADQARAYAESEGGGLREYLAWAELQSAEGARVSEAVLPETDDDSVRIMTIHGAKGLEFPITILSGLTTQAARRANGVQVLFPPSHQSGPGWAIRVKKDLENRDFERYGALDEQMGFHETLRLLYVAATRASDHLVVSMHRKARATAVEHNKMTMAELFASVLDDAPAFEHIAPDENAVEPPRLEPAAPLLDRSDWDSQRTSALDNSSRRRVLAATTIAKMAVEAAQAQDPGLAKDSRDLDLPPWQKGRYGTAIGRAVHGALQTADLHTGDGLADIAAAQAAAEGVLGKEAVVEALARSALGTTVVAEAIAGEYWREMYVAAPVGDDLLIEGYIDLLYRTDEGLVVVDYKTDAVPDAATLDAKLARYRLQGATYALAVEEATGESVSRVVFAFLQEDGSTERDVADLRAAIEEVRITATTATPKS